MIIDWHQSNQTGPSLKKACQKRPSIGSAGRALMQDPREPQKLSVEADDSSALNVRSRKVSRSSSVLSREAKKPGKEGSRFKQISGSLSKPAARATAKGQSCILLCCGNYLSCAHLSRIGFSYSEPKLLRIDFSRWQSTSRRFTFSTFEAEVTRNGFF